MEEIKLETLNKHNNEYGKDDKNKILRHALVKNSISSIAASLDEIKDYDFNFSIDIKTMPATNQKQSGRCWIFAATNVLREKIAKKCKMDNFELSQSYIAFYDRLEKSNYLLEAVIELIDADYDDRTLSYLLANGIGDGGQWDMFTNVIKKYGVVPKNVYPETATSSGTRETNSLINFNIRKFASESKEIYKVEGLEGVRKAKEELLKKIYFLLIDTYGVPPSTFNFEYVDVDNVYHLLEGYTPLTFLEEYVSSSWLDEFVSCIHSPTKTKQFNKTYTIKYLGNVVKGKDVTHLNMDMNRMKELIISQLKEGQIVWFGSDVSFYRDASGAWDDTKFDYLTPFGLDYKMDKGESLDFKASRMSHAMCITGVNLDKSGRPTKWKIENSWGDDSGKKGYYIMSDSYFEKYVYQAVINKKYLSKEELSALKESPIILKPWDPMGSLAD